MKQLSLNIFNQDFNDFIQSLNQAEVAYVLVGGYAVIIHGYNRTTGDLDIWVQKTEDNFQRLMNAFRSFGLPANAFSLEEFMNDSQQDVFTFGRPPVAIYLITNIKGLNFEDVYQDASLIEVDGLPLRLIQLPHLIAAKKAAGRFKDLDDLEHLNIKDV